MVRNIFGDIANGVFGLAGGQSGLIRGTRESRMLGRRWRSVAACHAAGVLAGKAALSQHQVSFVADATEDFFRRRIGYPIYIFLKLI
ncbi:hypothetical protein [Burkholderia aenigmatica]|uniref:hypothetical protein n=1 Tax=Burkholderia aenigmatica TaxID=2015348 RepID=UPI002656CE46|nr:hypothetical protein [Burkholderia aenigmatica]MDN7876134.1 hypothetical protein [Burkholderia aenigmatica]